MREAPAPGGPSPSGVVAPRADLWQWGDFHWTNDFGKPNVRLGLEASMGHPNPLSKAAPEWWVCGTTALDGALVVEDVVPVGLGRAGRLRQQLGACGGVQEGREEDVVVVRQLGDVKVGVGAVREGHHVVGSPKQRAAGGLRDDDGGPTGGRRDGLRRRDCLQTIPLCLPFTGYSLGPGMSRTNSCVASLIRGKMGEFSSGRAFFERCSGTSPHHYS